MELQEHKGTEQRARADSCILGSLLERTGLSHGSPARSQHSWELQLLNHEGLEEKRS